MSGAPLPACPLCDEPIDGWCRNVACGLYEVVLNPSDWRRPAAPPLPESVVAVLEAADDLFDERGFLCGGDVAHLSNQVMAYRRAGRPGASKVADQVKR